MSRNKNFQTKSSPLNSHSNFWLTKRPLNATCPMTRPCFRYLSSVQHRHTRTDISILSHTLMLSHINYALPHSLTIIHMHTPTHTHSLTHVCVCVSLLATRDVWKVGHRSDLFIPPGQMKSDRHRPCIAANSLTVTHKHRHTHTHTPSWRSLIVTCRY